MIRTEDYIPLALSEADAFARACPRRRDDIEQEACLAVAAAAADWLGPDEGFPDFARVEVRRALGRDRRREREARRDGMTGGDRPASAPSPAPAPSATPSRELTPGQVRRFERNAVIAAAARQGCPDRLLARVFDMAHSRIQAIVAEMEASR